MQEERDRQIKAMVSKTVRDGLEQTVLGLQQRLVLLESHIDDRSILLSSYFFILFHFYDERVFCIYNMMRYLIV